MNQLKLNEKSGILHCLTFRIQMPYNKAKQAECYLILSDVIT